MAILFVTLKEESKELFLIFFSILISEDYYGMFLPPPTDLDHDVRCDYDDRFSFTQPIVRTRQQRGPCKCYPNGYVYDNIESVAAFLKSPVPLPGQRLSDALNGSLEETSHGKCEKCKTFNQEGEEEFTDITNTSTTEIREAPEILYVVVDRQYYPANQQFTASAVRINDREIIENDLYLNMNGGQVYYDLIGGILHIPSNSKHVFQGFQFTSNKNFFFKLYRSLCGHIEN